jgi:hypothetical protein
VPANIAGLESGIRIQDALQRAGAIVSGQKHAYRLVVESLVEHDVLQRIGCKLGHAAMFGLTCAIASIRLSPVMADSSLVALL